MTKHDRLKDAKTDKEKVEKLFDLAMTVEDCYRQIVEAKCGGLELKRLQKLWNESQSNFLDMVAESKSYSDKEKICELFLVRRHSLFLKSFLETFMFFVERLVESHNISVEAEKMEGE